MQGKSERQKEKEKHELIFKYVKSLTPFHNPEADQYLQKLRSGGERKESILLNSKVFEVSVLAAKHKKRVSFADDETLVNGTKTSPKKLKAKSNNNKALGVKKADNGVETVREYMDCSPESVQNDLIELQRSVFTAFKIKHEARPNTMTYNSTKPPIYTSKNEMQYYSERLPQTTAPAKAESSIVRAKSCSTISQLGLSSKTNQTASLMQMNTIKSGLSRTQSQSQPTNSLPLSQSQPPNRSSIFSQQSHNLMVEIFKQKLHTKRVP
jgi:hypothetical protein